MARGICPIHEMMRLSLSTGMMMIEAQSANIMRRKTRANVTRLVWRGPIKDIG